MNSKSKKAPFSATFRWSPNNENRLPATCKGSIIPFFHLPPLHYSSTPSLHSSLSSVLLTLRTASSITETLDKEKGEHLRATEYRCPTLQENVPDNHQEVAERVDVGHPLDDWGMLAMGKMKPERRMMGKVKKKV